jgi:hemerythrin
MRSLKWSISHAVFVTEIDDEHKEIFEALSDFQNVSAGRGEVRGALQRLTSRIADHFAHEERLMRAARYGSLRWHKQRHDAARRRVEGLVLQIEAGDAKAGAELVEYLTSWLHDHTRVADRMMGAALRNHRRCMWKLTFTAGTKPLDACAWTTTSGEPLEAPARENAPKQN